VNVTEVRVRPKQDVNGGKVLGHADIVLDEMFAVHGIAIINGDTGLYVGMPFRVDENSKRKRKDICHPITEDCRRMIQDAVLDEFEMEP
jgi:stage V sporulation protein G